MVKELSLLYNLPITGERSWIHTFPNVKYKQPCPGFELRSPCPFAMMITIMPWGPSCLFNVSMSWIRVVTAVWLAIGLMSRMFANGSGDWGPISGQVIPKTQKKKRRYLMLPCLTLSIISKGSKVKWSNPGNGVASSPAPQCSSYWKGSLWVTLNKVISK